MSRLIGVQPVVAVFSLLAALTQATERSDFLFGMPERPLHGARIGWGESAIQGPVTEEQIAANPWWQAVREWQKRAGRHVRQKVILVGGFPRSGTTLMEMFLRMHPRRISALRFGEADHKHEGLHLFGHGSSFRRYGYSRIGSQAMFSRMCRVDEDSGKVEGHAATTEVDAVALFRNESWSAWQTWNFSEPMLMVKDPANLMRSRFLQAAFQETHDVFALFTLMHPLEIGGSGSGLTCNPQSKSRQRMAEQWLNCHNTWIDDLKMLRNYLVIPYEAWFTHPAETGLAIEHFLHLSGDDGVEVELPKFKSQRGSKGASKPRRLNFRGGGKFRLSRKYFARCRKQRSPKEYRSLPFSHLHEAFLKFGYDLSDTSVLHQPTAFELCVLDGKPCRSLS